MTPDDGGPLPRPEEMPRMAERRAKKVYPWRGSVAGTLSAPFTPGGALLPTAAGPGEAPGASGAAVDAFHPQSLYYSENIEKEPRGAAVGQVLFITSREEVERLREENAALRVWAEKLAQWLAETQQVMGKLNVTTASPDYFGWNQSDLVR